MQILGSYINSDANKSSKLSQDTPVLPQIATTRKFHSHSWYSFGDRHLTKFKYENKPRAITQKLSKQELRFMGTAVPPS